VLLPYRQSTITIAAMLDSPILNSVPPLVQPLASKRELRTLEHWRSCAKEARAVAERMRDPFSRQMMENVAANYDKLADWAARKQR
jgi:hypothetical protein